VCALNEVVMQSTMHARLSMPLRTVAQPSIGKFYAFFWAISRRLNFICRRFGTFCLFHLHRQVGVERLGLRNVGVFIREEVWLENSLSHWLSLFSFYTYLTMKMEQTECSETSAYKIQTPGNYPEENIKHSEHGESLKSRSKGKLGCKMCTPFWLTQLPWFVIESHMGFHAYRISVVTTEICWYVTLQAGFS